MEAVMGAGTVEEIVIPLIALAGTFVASVATGGWWFRGIKADLEKQIDKKTVDLRDGLLRDTGETITAIRTYIALVETKVGTLTLETERNFVRRSDFQNAIDSFNRSISDLRSEIRQEYGRLNDKLDQVIQGKPPSHR
jgi:hypothetical protein